MKRSFKILLFLVLIILCLWTYLWFNTAKVIESSLQNLHNDQYSLVSEKIEVKGFPFHFAVTINNAKLKYFNLNFNFNKFTITTNLLFNKLSIALPSKTDVNFIFNEQLHNLLINTDKDFFLNIKEHGTFNTFKVLNAIANKTFLDQNFYVKKLHLYADELLVSNATNNKEIAKEHIDCKMIFDNKSELVTSTDLNINFNEITLNSDEHIAHNLNKIELNGSIQILSKKQDAISLIEYANFDTLNLKVNETLFSLKGNIEQDKMNNASFKLYLGADNWIDLLNTLTNQNIISNDRYNLIIASIRDITGASSTESAINIKIYSDQLTGIRVGNSSAYRLMRYFEKFISTP